ncbi:receptor-like protein kinase ANXUR1 [Salvia splendens]|uniref:receptor-like protein kinase ANXUR1 n=1 Tax=Salvia splendens TaxID=180675 RepID=UPI001C2793E5|nr:receptor-like protein kinase ANXUR1 [Salvia splendens]
MPKVSRSCFQAVMVRHHNHTIINVILSIATISLLSHTTHAQDKPLILSCGGSSASAKDADGRSWDPDDKFLSAGARSVAAKSGVQDPSLPSEIPYMTARIFQSEGKYQFPIKDTKSRTMLRLHFYPSSYPNFDISKSYFAVVAGGVTLLNNFSASMSAEALSQAYFIKEFFLAPSDSPTLDVTFTPAAGAFAFVNGIEVLPIPAIFDSDPALAGTVGAGVDATGATTVPIGDSSMETMFRLNVGGQYVSPVNDSGGLMRSWYDDSVYLYGAATGVAVAANVSVAYKTMPPFMAPLDVYSTYRSMGAYKDVNKISNLTWIFEVDPNFMYMVRFHWCDSEMTRSNQRVFNIYINNKTAEYDVDVFAMTMATATPVKKDFVARVGADSGSQLWVSLHPTESARSQFADVLLNGLEIFKLSDVAKRNLAGPNPTISDLMRRYQDSHMGPASFEEEKSAITTVIITGAGGAVAFGLAFVVCLFVYQRKRRGPKGDGATTWLPISWNSNTSSTTIKSSMSGRSQGMTISSDAACNCRYFSLTEIIGATKNFDESNVIGVGGFGKVYKGVVDGGTMVAVKRSNPSSDQGINEFQTEIEMLSRLRHRHLVSLIGFCEDNGEMILVYDYMGQGTLREHLYKGNKVILSWKQRLEICIGAARGLHYLHTGARYTIIHRDVKTTNILLDDKWVAKMSDFGLSKTGPDMNKGHVSTVVKGSFGYLDPEYFRRQQLTEKSDVYSFGVVLFEVLCARPVLNPSLPKEQVSLADWAMRCARNGTLEEIIDPQLQGKMNQESLNKFMETAEKCLADHGTDRPSMGDVLWNLEFALQLHENPDNKRGESAATGSVDFQGQIDQNSIMAMHRSILNIEDDDDDEEARKSKNESDNPDEIFSQIINPTGR